MSPTELAGAVFGLLAVWLTVRQSVWCWPTGLVNVTLYAFVFFEAKLYADVGLQVVYFVLCAVGWWRWLTPGAEREELPVTRLGRREGFVLLALGMLCATAMGTLLATRTDAALPFWDSTTVVMSLVAQWLVTRKVLENWHLWIAADVLMVGIYCAKELDVTTGLYVIFTLLAVQGLREWRRSMTAPAA
jgi:nicotinamide mononucleotide transporter